MTDAEMLIDALTQMADDDDIVIYNYHFSDTKKAACYETNGLKTIILDRSAITCNDEECCLLIEEVGHYSSRTRYYADPDDSAQSRQIREHMERKNKSWISKKFVPYDKLISFIDREIDVTLDEIAEHFKVPVKIIVTALDRYRACGLL